MPSIGLILSLVAALFFLMIGLEELPVRFNVRRVRASIARRARLRGRAEIDVLHAMARNTRASVWILIFFAVASGVLLLVRIQGAPPSTAGWEAEASLHVFGATLVLGLLFLAFAFHVWAPRLLAAVRAELAASSSKAQAPFLAQKDSDGDDPRLP